VVVVGRVKKSAKRVFHGHAVKEERLEDHLPGREEISASVQAAVGRIANQIANQKICKTSFMVVPWFVPHGVQYEEGTMPRVIPTEDVRPLSEFRANTAAFMNQVRETRRPVILTQHGRSAAVLLDVRAYEDLVERAEVLNDVRRAQTQIAEGKGIADSDFKKIVLERLGL